MNIISILSIIGFLASFSGSITSKKFPYLEIISNNIFSIIIVLLLWKTMLVVPIIVMFITFILFFTLIYELYSKIF